MASRSFNSPQTRRVQGAHGTRGDLSRLQGQIDSAFKALESGKNIDGDGISIKHSPASYDTKGETLGQHLEGIDAAMSKGGHHTHENIGELNKVTDGGHDQLKNNPHATGFDNLVPRKLAALNKVVLDAELDAAGTPRPPMAHELCAHEGCTLKELNECLVDAALDAAGGLRPPSTHSHELGGAHEMCGDKVAIAYTPQHYKPSPAYLDNKEPGQLGAHLKGIDEFIGGGKRTRYLSQPIDATLVTGGRCEVLLFAPSDMARVEKAALVVWGKRGGEEIDIDLHSRYAREGEPVNNHMESDTTTMYSLEPGAIARLDIKHLFPALSGGDVCQLSILANSTEGPLIVLGLLMEYST